MLESMGGAYIRPVLDMMARFEDLWHSKREQSGKIVPAWSSFRPSELAPYVPRLAVIEMFADGTARFRLAGNELELLSGTDTSPEKRGWWLNPVESQIISPYRQQALARPCGYRSSRYFCDAEGRHSIPGILTALPMTGAAGDVSLFLSWFASPAKLDEIGRYGISYKLDGLEFIDIGAGCPGESAEFAKILHLQRDQR